MMLFFLKFIIIKDEKKKLRMRIMTLEKIGKLNEGFNPKDLLGQTIWAQTPSGSKVQEKII